MKSFITKNMFEFLYPRRCPVCGDILLESEYKACVSCMKLLQFVEEPKCKKCGKPIYGQEAEYCFDCQKKQYHFKQGCACWVYSDKMKDSIAAFKYKNKKEFAEFYVEEMLRRYSGFLRETNPDALIPVPIHISKRRQRGYNQAEILADQIGSQMNIPVYRNILIRNKKTMPQKMLNDAERLKNLKEAFTVVNMNYVEEMKLKTVMLIDDIYTSGSTIEACTNALLKCQIETVYFLSICIGKGF